VILLQLPLSTGSNCSGHSDYDAGFGRGVHNRDEPGIQGLIWIDYAIVAVVVVSALLGLFRGLIQETLSLLSWIAALWVGIHYHPAMALRLQSILPQPELRTAAAFATLFIVTLVVGRILAYLIATLIEHSPLAVFNRLGGLLFGASRGVLLLLVLVLIAQSLDLGREPWWRESRLLPRLEPWAAKLGRLDPQRYLVRFP